MDEATFRGEVARAVELYERAIRHAATHTRTMIETYGEVEALSRLIISPDLQQGFKVLRDRSARADVRGVGRPLPQPLQRIESRPHLLRTAQLVDELLRRDQIADAQPLRG